MSSLFEFIWKNEEEIPYEPKWVGVGWQDEAGKKHIFKVMRVKTYE